MEPTHSPFEVHHQFARAVAEQSRWAEAEAAFRVLLDDLRRVLGHGHPDTLVRHALDADS
jgi:hypothetical protein